MRRALRPAALLAGLLSVMAACDPETGQTALVVTATLPGPVDCLRVGANRSGGEVVGGTLAVAAAPDWRTVSPQALIYSGGALGEAEIQVAVTGHRGGCDTAPVARGEATGRFTQGRVKPLPVMLSLLSPDRDVDGFADANDCRPDDPLSFPREGGEGERGECNGVDDDCDGVVDEGCPCTAAVTCYPLGTGHPTAGVGACRLGSQACEGGRLGACVGAVVPAAEACDGVDTDCDGTPDPASCPCAEGATRDCYSAGPAPLAGVGACRKGTQRCTGGGFTACLGDVAPAAESCNGVDDDCDGQVDEPSDIDLPACIEQRGVCAGAKRGCGAQACAEADYARAATAAGLRYVAAEGTGDCDGFDNDCDGVIDEGCPCRPGATEACHPAGPGSSTATTGACRPGTHVCQPDATWGTCTGFVAPSAETCNGADDDCDGTTDEEFPGKGVACPAPRPGRCAAGVKACVNGAETCESSSSPAAESCNGADDDCDGQVDEDFQTQTDAAHCGASCSVCGAAQRCCGGACASTNSDPANCGGCGIACAAGSACCGAACARTSDDPRNCGGCGVACALGQACRGSRCVPAREAACDNGDEDLDGLSDCADPDCASGASCDVRGGTCCRSACAHETTCSNSADDDCDGLVDCADPDCSGRSAVELCNGVDDDCDGQVDEDFPTLRQPCSDGLGICRRDGVILCTSTTTSGCGVSANTAAARAETCNGLDDDCDGAVDDGFPVGVACFEGIGVCRTQGAGICLADGTSACGAVPNGAAASAEKCNALDDDCDGATDEDFSTLGTACSAGQGACRTSGSIVCKADGTAGCSVAANAAAASAEKCNTLDDDCDGQVDEEFVLGAACTAGLGVCRTSGSTVCKPDGTAGCSVSANAAASSSEKCNTLDDDCDGLVDEDFSVGTACAAGAGACLVTGAIVCKADGSAACSAVANPSASAIETCNGVDDDCNGTTDDVAGLGTCSVGVGECAASGPRVCGAGAVVVCSAVAKAPSVEVCDGKDNDCDGIVDNVAGLGATCSVGVGECAASGTKACSGGALVCNAVAKAPSVEVCDGKDNDCNGVADNGFNAGAACSVGVGACARTGTFACKADKTGTQCTATAGSPGRELCNGVDDDCDGSTDEWPECGGPRADFAENATATWTFGESASNAPEPCAPVNRGNVSLFNAAAAQNVLVGANATRIDLATTGVYYFQGIYPLARNGNWDLSTTTGINFYMKSVLPNNVGWEGLNPVVVLCGPAGYRAYLPPTNVITGNYLPYQIPINGGGGWTVVNSGTFNLNTVNSIEFHQNPLRNNNPGTVYVFIDDARFY